MQIKSSKADDTTAQKIITELLKKNAVSTSSITLLEIDSSTLIFEYKLGTGKSPVGTRNWELFSRLTYTQTS